MNFGSDLEDPTNLQQDISCTIGIAKEMHISESLSIMSEELEPEKITEFLATQPTRCWRKGETIATSAGYGPAAGGGWFIYSCEVKSRSVTEHFDWLVSKVCSLAAQLVCLQNDGYWLSICCTMSSPKQLVSFTIPAKTPRSLAELGLEVDFTVALDDGPKKKNSAKGGKYPYRWLRFWINTIARYWFSS